jgi:hypothetical protein
MLYMLQILFVFETSLLEIKSNYSNKNKMSSITFNLCSQY